MGRRFITRADIDAALRAGDDAVRVGARDTVTDVAREYAQQHGVRIERSAEDSSQGPAVAPRTDEQLRRKVRRAVVAELGESPPGLDEAIERVLRADDEATGGASG